MKKSLWRAKRDGWALALGLGLIPVVAASMLVGCSDDSKNGGSAGATETAVTCDAPGGPESGAVDMHCIGDDGRPIIQATGVCQSAEGSPGTDYGDPIYNASGGDDDCKYDVSYTVSPICENAAVTFTMTAKRRADNSAVTGAKPFLAATLGTHSGLTGGQTTVEQAGGVYQIGPIQFDQPGEWTVRFHFFEACSDESMDSPHGHVAFFVTVP